MLKPNGPKIINIMPCINIKNKADHFLVLVNNNPIPDNNSNIANK